MTETSETIIQLRNSILFHEMATLAQPAFGVAFAVICLYRGKHAVNTEPTVKDVLGKEEENGSGEQDEGFKGKQTSQRHDNVHFAYLDGQWGAKVTPSAPPAVPKNVW